MIDIRDVAGTLIVSVPVTEGSEHVSELMVSDYVLLSYLSLTGAILPAGAYIVFEGVTYRLLKPYIPLRVDELEYRYEPQFHAKVMSWGVRPFFFLQIAEGVVTGRESDWTLTDNLPNFLAAIVASLLDEFAETYTYAYDASLTGTKSLTFQATSIFDALNEIATAWETEWYLNGTVITFGKCAHGTAVTLTVGTEVSVPDITPASEGYYTRFYAFGSTRNITQDYDSGSTTNHIVQKRLALPAATCPLGYKDSEAGLDPTRIFTKVLVYDDIYPSSDLAISAVRAVLKFAYDGDGNKIQIGIDELGQPVYQTYSIFFFKILGFNFTEEMIVEGKTLSAHFQTGNLMGREFELGYTSATTEYEIIFDESSGYIIPNEIIIPSDGDSVILFNILMPQAYVDAAEATLEAAVDAEIANQEIDLSTYRINSFPVKFTELGITLIVGRNVTFVNGLNTLSTRVLSISSKLDFPAQMTIQIGEKKAYRTTQQLKEAVTNINKNVDVIATLNDLSVSIQNAYGRTQKQIAESLAQWNYMWYFDKSADTTPDQTDSSLWKVRSNFDLFINGQIQAAEEITAWIAGAVQNEVLANLTATAPIRKDTVSNVRLDYATNQFELVAGVLTIQDGLFTPAAHTHVIGDVTGLQTALNAKLETSLKGAVSGLAELDATGKVPAAQLPAATASLELGETSLTAYRGDRGKTAYDHSQVTGSNPHQSTFAQLVGLPTTLAGYGITDAQAADADLTAIAALIGTSGLLKKTAANTWALDTSVYLTSITKANVEAVLTGAITSHTHAYIPTSHTVNSIANGAGFLKNNGTGTWSWDNSTYSLSSHTHAYEPALGNPVTTGHILSSNSAGVRSWVAQAAGVTDHGALSGLADDDHSQYYNQARGDARYSLSSHNHAASYEPIIGKTTGYARWTGAAWEFKNEAYSLTSHTHSGYEASLGNPAVNGYVLSSSAAGLRAWIAMESGVTDHGALTGLADDDHTQYYNQTRGDARYAALSHTHSTYALLNAAITAIGSLYTVQSTDNNKIIECTGTFTVTLPNSMAVGFQVTIVNVSTGTITIGAASTIYSKSSNRKLASQWIGATAYHRGSDVWVLMGDLTA